MFYKHEDARDWAKCGSSVTVAYADLCKVCSCRYCCNICSFYQVTIWTVRTKNSWSYYLECSYNWRTCKVGRAGVRTIRRVGVLAWCTLVIVDWAIASYVVYCCVAFPSSSKGQNIAASVPRISKCHALVNTLTSSSGSNGHLLSLFVKRFRRRHIPWVQFFCCAQFSQAALEVLSRLVSDGSHW